MTGRLTALTGLVAAVLALAACENSHPIPKLTYAERPCYRTLAEVDCHASALVGEENRRVGFYDEPVSVEQVEPWLLRLF